MAASGNPGGGTQISASNPAGGVADFEAPIPGFGNIADNRETEPGAASGPIETAAAGKGFLKLFRRDALAIVGNSQDDKTAFAARMYRNLSLCVARGILGKISDRFRQIVRVNPGNCAG